MAAQANGYHSHTSCPMTCSGPSSGHFIFDFENMFNDDLPSNNSLFDYVMVFFTLDFINVYGDAYVDDLMNSFNFGFNFGAETSADEFRSSGVRGPASGGLPNPWGCANGFS